MAIDNVIVEVDGPEMPALNGSASGWVEALNEAGIVGQGCQSSVLSPVEPYAAVHNGCCLGIEPADELVLTCAIHYDHPMIGTMTRTFKICPDRFASEIAPARTYGFASEIEQLRQRGLGLGGSLENALVIYEDHFSAEPLYADEPLRHKALDLLGDLFVLGRRLLGRITAFRPGHTINHAFVKALLQASPGGVRV